MDGEIERANSPALLHPCPASRRQLQLRHCLSHSPEARQAAEPWMPSSSWMDLRHLLDAVAAERRDGSHRCRRRGDGAVAKTSMKWSYCVDDDDADADDENGESDELEEASMPSEDTRTQMLRRRRWLLLLQRGIAAIVGLLLPQESTSKSMAGMKPPSWTTMGHWGKREWRADHAPSSPTSASCLLPCEMMMMERRVEGNEGVGVEGAQRARDGRQSRESIQPAAWKGSSQARQPAPALDAALSGATSQAARGGTRGLRLDELRR